MRNAGERKSVGRIDPHRLVGDAELGRHGDRPVNVLVLSRRRRDEEQPAFLEPDVLAERAHRSESTPSAARAVSSAASAPTASLSRWSDDQ